MASATVFREHKLIRRRLLALLLALAVALLPMHALNAKPLAGPETAAVPHQDGCDHGAAGKIAAKEHCSACGVCHVLAADASEPITAPDLAATPSGTPVPVLHGLSPQPDLHPPTTSVT